MAPFATAGPFVSGYGSEFVFNSIMSPILRVTADVHRHRQASTFEIVD